MNDVDRWQVGVVIPACNEEETVVAAIHAVQTALRQAALSDRSWIVVVCDSCVDRTRSLASAALEGNGEVLDCQASSAGAARRLGVATVLAHFAATPLDHLWIANTDADTCVSEDWIQHQLRYADQGCAGVAGIVSVDAVATCNAYQLRELFAGYEIYADGSHPHVHGANMGVRADAYVDAGGWSDKALAEDHCLWDRLKRCHWPVIASAASVVTTSGRLIGRARGGFADSLRLTVASLYG